MRWDRARPFTFAAGVLLLLVSCVGGCNAVVESIVAPIPPLSQFEPPPPGMEIIDTRTYREDRDGRRWGVREVDLRAREPLSTEEAGRRITDAYAGRLPVGVDRRIETTAPEPDLVRIKYMLTA